MSHQQLDLDITNYTLQDMLQLLGLPVGFTKHDLKEAMRVVASLHPDKSGAPPEVYQLLSNSTLSTSSVANLLPIARWHAMSRITRSHKCGFASNRRDSKRVV
jgi:hypothetical protein